MANGKGGRRGSSKDEQIEILRAIWNEMKALNARASTRPTTASTQFGGS